jgi:uncharacterized protein (TIGR00725 family)
MRRSPIVGVIGGGEGTAPVGSAPYELAREVGAKLGRRGAIVLTGGGTGVMEAAMLGASSARGHSLGILKTEAGRHATKAEYAVVTGMGDGRNYLNAFIPDVLIALPGEAGTLSEIALALKVGTPVVCTTHWRFLEDNGFAVMAYADSADEAVAAAYRALAERCMLQGDGTMLAPIKRPSVPNQSALLDDLARKVEQWCP